MQIPNSRAHAPALGPPATSPELPAASPSPSTSTILFRPHVCPEDEGRCPALLSASPSPRAAAHGAAKGGFLPWLVLPHSLQPQSFLRPATLQPVPRVLKLVGCGRWPTFQHLPPLTLSSCQSGHGANLFSVCALARPCEGNLHAITRCVSSHVGCACLAGCTKQEAHRRFRLKEKQTDDCPRGTRQSLAALSSWMGLNGSVRVGLQCAHRTDSV